MIFTVSVYFLTSILIDSDAVLNEAAKSGFYYRSVDISVVEKCDSSNTCIDLNNKKYRIKRKDRMEVECTSEKDKITIHITPESAFISYFLYIEHKSGVYRVQMNKKSIVIDSGAQNIYKIQLVGTAATGPAIIWGKAFKEPPVRNFDKSFGRSLNNLRQFYFMKPLEFDEDLKQAAESSFERVKADGLVHYSSKTGSIRHTGISKKVIGENLFIAESEQKAWEMMVNSPSHLYNLINPQFNHFYYLQKKQNDVLRGVVVFSE